MSYEFICVCMYIRIYIHIYTYLFHIICVLFSACVYASALHPNDQAVTADDLPVQAGSPILYILQFLGTAMLQQPEFVNELSSGCRQSLRVISSSFSQLLFALFGANLCCLCETCLART